MRKWINKSNFLFAFRFSPLIIKMWLLFRPSVNKELKIKKAFYKSTFNQNVVLERNILIFDVGANEGFITNIFLTLGYNVISVEPDTHNINILKQRFKNEKKVTIEPVALGKNEGKEKIFIAENEHTLTTLSTKWKVILENKTRRNRHEFIDDEKWVSVSTLNKLIDNYGLPYYAKIDAEGFELEILKGLNKTIPLISFEGILPEFALETIACIHHLNEINNLYRYNISLDNKFLSQHFCTKNEVIEGINSVQNCTVEIFCSVAPRISA
ncbi:MAG: FkbM family methyltransferase [Ferruginibacter sp.]